MKEIIFLYETKEIIIQCNEEELFKDIFEKFKTKLGINSINLSFLFGGNLIDSSKKVNEISNIENNKMKILAISSEIDEEKNFLTKSIKLIEGKKKEFIISDNKIDIGTYLNMMEINIYDKVYITIKNGNYFWNELYRIPENVYIYMAGENYPPGGSYGKDNKVKIIINQPTKPCETCTHNNHISYVKLIISRDSTFELRIIDFIENIPTIKNELCPGGSAFGIISLSGDNSRLYLLESSHSISCSPFVNGIYIGFQKVFLANISFSKDINSDKDKIYIVGNKKGWNWGSKMDIYCNNIVLDKFCFIFDEKNENKNIACFKD